MNTTSSLLAPALLSAAFFALLAYANNRSRSHLQLALRDTAHLAELLPHLVIPAGGLLWSTDKLTVAAGCLATSNSLNRQVILVCRAPGNHWCRVRARYVRRSLQVHSLTPITEADARDDLLALAPFLTPYEEFFGSLRPPA